jgi:hypothetical protein
MFVEIPFDSGALIDLNKMHSKKEQLTPRNEKEKANDKVKVILRVRPFVETEEAEEFISPMEVLLSRVRITPYQSISLDSHPI